MIAFVFGVLLLAAPTTVEQANGLLRAGDAPAAHRLLHTHLQEHPGDAAAWTVLGSALLMQKRVAEAADAYARARALDPTAGAAFFGEAEARLALGLRGDAAALYQAYLRAENGRTDILDQAATARLAGLVSPSKGGTPGRPAADPSAALPWQLGWGVAGGAVGGMLGLLAGAAVFFVGFEVLDTMRSDSLRDVTAFSAAVVGFGATFGGIAYGVRYAGRKHHIHGSLWRGMVGAVAGAAGSGLLIAVVAETADQDTAAALGVLLVPLSVVLGAAMANNQVLVPPTEDTAELLPAPSKRVPSVLVLPAR